MLCGCPQIRQVELQFTVGEALSCAGAGRASEVARDPWAVEQLQNTDCEEVKGTMQELIDMIIKKYATSTAPYVRQVSKIVFVQIDCSFCCFILYCGQNQTRQKIRNFISQKQMLPYNRTKSLSELCSMVFLFVVSYVFLSFLKRLHASGCCLS